MEKVVDVDNIGNKVFSGILLQLQIKDEFSAKCKRIDLDKLYLICCFDFSLGPF